MSLRARLVPMLAVDLRANGPTAYQLAPEAGMNHVSSPGHLVIGGGVISWLAVWRGDANNAIGVYYCSGLLRKLIPGLTN